MSIYSKCNVTMKWNAGETTNASKCSKPLEYIGTASRRLSGICSISEDNRRVSRCPADTSEAEGSILRLHEGGSSKHEMSIVDRLPEGIRKQ